MIFLGGLFTGTFIVLLLLGVFKSAALGPVWERYALPPPDDEGWAQEGTSLVHKCGLVFIQRGWGKLQFRGGCGIAGAYCRRDLVKYEKEIAKALASRKYLNYLQGESTKLLEASP